jgi:hypothetical protein
MPTLDIQTTAGGDDGTDDGTTFSSGFDGVLIGQGFDVVQNSWYIFRNVTINQGQPILTSYMTLQAINDAAEFAAGTLRARIVAIAEDNHAVPTTHAQWVTDHGIHTTAFVDWDFPAISSGTKVTPGMNSIIQEIINRSGWVSGNAIGIHIDDRSTTNPTSQEFAAFEDVLQAPTLHIEYGAEPEETPGKAYGQLFNYPLSASIRGRG